MNPKHSRPSSFGWRGVSCAYAAKPHRPLGLLAFLQVGPDQRWRKNVGIHPLSIQHTLAALANVKQGGNGRDHDDSKKKKATLADGQRVQVLHEVDGFIQKEEMLATIGE